MMMIPSDETAIIEWQKNTHYANLKMKRAASIYICLAAFHSRSGNSGIIMIFFLSAAWFDR